MIKIIVILFCSISIGCLGHVYLKIGMNEIGEFDFSAPATWLAYFFKVIVNYRIIFGVFLQALFFGTWLVLLSKADLSLLLPLTAIEYIMGAIFSHFVLDERISLLRLAGTLVVCMGVGMICFDQFRREDRNTTQVKESAPVAVAESPSE